ncbi:Glycosyltransferase 61 [Arabidopsis thaliana x Arabidopsis arenosa]|uniref:Glycosyltransferase 61 n=1 Tax=Arabidopsis thaliana x Arabidopsis arenosa TaxID=1240361 RepID=A0A8T2ARG6_9BRAS|nr:Glycosyltransferase 61 [Arabidopsis thaliana x Arabidopsis arenosa]
MRQNLKKVAPIKVDESPKLFPYVFRFKNSCGNCAKRSKPKLIYLLLFSLISSCFVFAPDLLCFPYPSALFLIDSSIKEIENRVSESHIESPKTSQNEESISCDRTGYRSDICFMKGDIRTHSPSSSIFLYTSNDLTDHVLQDKIKPYTRKWETSIMETIHELKLVTKDVKLFGDKHKCEVIHEVPAVLFSTGGYTGNLYHEFNDGLIPLYITSKRFNKKVVFVIAEYHKWWEMKYGDVLSQLSDYPLIDFNKDKRTHCFKEAIVGLRIHGELTVDPSQMQDGRTTINEFRNVLDRAYRPRINRLDRLEEQRFHERVAKRRKAQRPKLALFSRTGSRGITNEDLMVQLAQRIGFEVEVLRPDRTTELAKIYRVLNSSKVMVGVHGAAMTHFLFMKPGSIFIQIIPLGTDWAAETYYGEPAKKLGLDYIGYKILPRESSLYEKYDKDDPILRDPNSITKKGWQFTKGIYLNDQKVRLDLHRFKKVLVDAYSKSIS